MVVSWHDMARSPLKKEPVPSKCRTDNRRASRHVRRASWNCEKLKLSYQFMEIAYAVYPGL